MMQRSTTIIFVAILASFVTSLQAQTIELSNWQTYSSMRSVRAATVDAANRIWCATSGGVFVHDPAEGTTTEFRNVNALSSLDVTAIASDSETGTVYVGAFDGSLDIASADLQWRSIGDIRRATQYQRRRINDMLVHNKRLYIATDFGIVVFDVQRRLFLETVDRIGPLQEKTSVSSIAILRDSIWAATPAGVLAAPLGVQTLRQPSVWTAIDSSYGLPATGNSIIRSNGRTVFVVNNTSVLRHNGQRFETVRTASAPILALSFRDTVGFISLTSGVYSIGGVPTPAWPGELRGHISYKRTDGTHEFVGFVEGTGIVRMAADGTTAAVAINSPTISQFTHVRVDAQGNIWSASYDPISRVGRGANRFDGTTWTTYSPATSSLIASNDIYRISPLRDGRVVLGSWGRGAVVVDPSGDVQQVYDQRETALAGIATDPTYVLVADAALDSRGQLWMVNEQAGDRMLVSVGVDGTSRKYVNCTDPRGNLFRALAIDAAGNKWLAGPNGNGLLAYNERSTPDDESDDYCLGIRSSNTNLPDNIVTALELDQNGALWIGTAKGVAVISSPTIATSTTIPFVRRVSALSAVQVNDIYVDALNYKWIATTTGVYVLNEDGTEVVATIASASTPLLSDNVRSVAVDAGSGRAWFGHAEGLSSVQTQSMAPRATFDVRCYPQPFRLGSGVQLTIDGLAPDTDLRILSPDGIMITALQTRGRQALWDGTDVNGRRVQPGVYVVQVRSATTKEASVGKIVVTR